MKRNEKKKNQKSIKFACLHFNLQHHVGISFEQNNCHICKVESLNLGEDYFFYEGFMNTILNRIHFEIKVTSMISNKKVYMYSSGIAQNN